MYMTYQSFTFPIPMSFLPCKSNKPVDFIKMEVEFVLIRTCNEISAHVLFARANKFTLFLKLFKENEENSFFKTCARGLL